VASLECGSDDRHTLAVRGGAGSGGCDRDREFHMSNNMRGFEVKSWSDEERATLRRMHENGISRSKIGKLLGRSKNSVQNQLSRMDLVRSDRNPVRPANKHEHPAIHRASTTTLPLLPSLEGWDGTGWPSSDDFWP
jgi:hypothetical protein